MDANTQMTTALVPVSHPAHPSHNRWLDILVGVLKAATAIGPAVVTIASPQNATLAQQLGQVASAAEAQIPGSEN